MITGLALINEVEDRLGWRQTETLEGVQRPETRKLLRLLNRILHSMQALDDWPLLRAEGDLQLVAAETGTATIAYLAEGGTQVVLNGASFDDSYKTRLIKFGPDDTLYRITRIVTETTLEFNRPWVGDAVAADELAYTIVQDRYALPADFDRPTGGWENFFGNSTISPIGPEEFLEKRRARGGSLIYSDPDVFTVYGLDDSETFQIIHFDPYPENDRILYYTYQKNHPEIETDEDRVLFPKTHEGVVIEAMLHLANRDYQDDAKTQLILQDYIRGLNQAQSVGNVSHDRLRLSPNGAHRFSQWTKYRGGRRVDWGSLFDRSDKYGLS